MAPPPRISKSIFVSIYSIDLELGSMMIDVSPHNRLKPEFSISPQGALLGRPFPEFQNVSPPTVFIRLFWNLVELYWASVRIHTVGRAPLLYCRSCSTPLLYASQLDCFLPSYDRQARAQSWTFRFSSKKRCEVRFLKSSSRLTADSFDPIDL